MAVGAVHGRGRLMPICCTLHGMLAGMLAFNAKQLVVAVGGQCFAEAEMYER